MLRFARVVCHFDVCSYMAYRPNKCRNIKRRSHNLIRQGVLDGKIEKHILVLLSHLIMVDISCSGFLIYITCLSTAATLAVYTAIHLNSHEKGHLRL